MTTSRFVSGSRQPASARRRSSWSFSGSTVTDYLNWRAFSGSRPADVVVLDLTLGDGTTVTENVRRLVADGSSVLIHSVADRPAAVREALAVGAAGVVSKSSPIDDVTSAIRTVAHGEPLNNVEWASAVDGDRAFADAQLSARERDVLRLYAAGLPLRQSPISWASRTPPPRRTSPECASSTSTWVGPRRPRSICSAERWRTAFSPSRMHPPITPRTPAGDDSVGRRHPRGRLGAHRAVARCHGCGRLLHADPDRAHLHAHRGFGFAGAGHAGGVRRYSAARRSRRSGATRWSPSCSCRSAR